MNNYPKTALVVNCGSSSVKFAILDPKDGHVFLNGIAEALGLDDARISWKFNGGDKTEQSLGAGADHKKALEYLVKNVLAKDQALLDSIVACGHRIVQGGDIYSEPTLINDEVEENIRKVIPFAPLHNPAHLLGIDAARASFPSIPHVAVFDTAFHQTMPPKAYRYAIPEEYYTDLHLRKYGAHGTSHMFLSQEAAKLLGKPVEQCNIITCHLGNGASISAVKGGKCIDTSMGLTPLDGLIMGTRCGSIDASVAFFLCDKMGMTPEEVKEVPYSELQKVYARSGGAVLFKDYLAIEDKDIAEEFGVSEDLFTHEYSWTKEDVVELLKNPDKMDELKDALDFAPEGIINLIVDTAVELRVPDVNKRQVITEATGKNINSMIANQIELDKQIAEARGEKESKKPTQRRASAKTEEKTGRRAG